MPASACPAGVGAPRLAELGRFYGRRGPGDLATDTGGNDAGAGRRNPSGRLDVARCRAKRRDLRRRRYPQGVAVDVEVRVPEAISLPDDRRPRDALVPLARFRRDVRCRFTDSPIVSGARTTANVGVSSVSGSARERPATNRPTEPHASIVCRTRTTSSARVALDAFGDDAVTKASREIDPRAQVDGKPTERVERLDLRRRDTDRTGCPAGLGLDERIDVTVGTAPPLLREPNGAGRTMWCRRQNAPSTSSPVGSAASIGSKDSRSLSPERGVSPPGPPPRAAARCARRAADGSPSASRCARLP